MAADTVRSAKSGNDWSSNELTAFNIDIVPEDVATFFGHPNLAAVQPTVDPIILNNLDKPPGPIRKSTRLFFRYSRDAMMALLGPPLAMESAVRDFALYLLGLLDYDEPDRAIHQEVEIAFYMCGTRVHAEPDICILDATEQCILLVQEDKFDSLASDATEPQLIAEAIAAFCKNNERRDVLGLSQKRSTVFPGIIVKGTTPVFYKIPVSADLAHSVVAAQYPPQKTVVEKLVPPVPKFDTLLEDGMRPVENRRVILQCLEAFKQFLQH